MLKMENYQGNTNYNLLEDSDIVDNLTTTSTNKVLSANQGKVLNQYISEADNVVELWTGSTHSNPNIVTLSDRYTNYKALIFKHTEKNYLCWVDIPKENVIGQLVGFSWENSQIPVFCVIDMNNNSSGNTLKFALQRSNWQGESHDNTVTAIYGVKRIGD